MAVPSSDIHRRAEELAGGLPSLLVAATRVASTLSQGVHGRRRVGQGETFWQFRRYEPGDPTQRIDWRQSAKTERVYVRETEWEAAQSVWLWLDGSASMAYSSAPDYPSKGHRANLIGLALAVLLMRGGERVALLGSGKAPASGRGALARLAEVLEGDRLPDSCPPAVEPLPRHGRVVMVGDFLDPLERWTRAVAAFADRGLTGHLLQVVDPAEETLPFQGRVLFDGMEREGHVLIGRVESLRPEYRRTMDEHRRALADLARTFGWTFAVHRTDRPPETALLGLFRVLTEIPEV